MRAAHGPPLSLDAQLHRLPQLSLLRAVHLLLVGRISVLGKHPRHSLPGLHGTATGCSYISSIAKGTATYPILGVVTSSKIALQALIAELTYAALS